MLSTQQPKQEGEEDTSSIRPPAITQALLVYVFAQLVMFALAHVVNGLIPISSWCGDGQSYILIEDYIRCSERQIARLRYLSVIVSACVGLMALLFPKVVARCFKVR